MDDLLAPCRVPGVVRVPVHHDQVDRSADQPQARGHAGPYVLGDLAEQREVRLTQPYLEPLLEESRLDELRERRVGAALRDEQAGIGTAHPTMSNGSRSWAPGGAVK